MEGDNLIALTRVLQGYETSVKTASSKTVVFVVKAKDRVQLAASVNDSLKKAGLRFQGNVADKASSFPITVINGKSGITYKIIYKPAKGGGSGAGADVTKLAESSQALYAAMAFVLGKKISKTDLSKANFDKALKIAITDENYDKMLNELPEDWIDSSIKGANKLLDTLKGRNYEFHRGSPKVDIIEKAFKAINKEERAFGDLNKWSPADIYAIKKGFDVRILEKEKTLKGLNEKMFELINKNEVIGISLKKITGGAKISNKNFPTDPKVSKASYKGGRTNVQAMDGYVQWGSSTKESIQFRSFGGETNLSGWQGEIKGASANQGKISLGPINYILKRHGLKQIPESKQSASLAAANTKQHAEDIAKMMSDYGTINSNEVGATATEIQSKSNKYRYSKYLVMKILLTLKDAQSKIADAVVEDFYLYASSQTSFSAPYMKME